MDKTQFLQHFKGNTRLKLYILFLILVISGVVIFELHFHLIGAIIFVIGCSILMVIHGISPHKIKK